jgi:hypothetical protein
LDREAGIANAPTTEPTTARRSSHIRAVRTGSLLLPDRLPG